jgi:hypothetical protein
MADAPLKAEIRPLAKSSNRQAVLTLASQFILLLLLPLLYFRHYLLPAAIRKKTVGMLC